MKFFLSLSALSLVSTSVIPLQARSSANAPFSVGAPSDYSKRLETDYDYSKRAAEAGSDYDHDYDKRAAEADSDYDYDYDKRTSSDYTGVVDYSKRDGSDYSEGDYAKKVAVKEKRAASARGDTDYSKRAGTDYDGDYGKRTTKAEGDYEGDYRV